MHLHIIAQRDPWADYNHPGKGKDKPIIPEPSAYGFFLLATLLVLLIVRRKRNK